MTVGVGDSVTLRVVVLAAKLTSPIEKFANFTKCVLKLFS